MSKKILIITGEASGDLHGANLVKSLKEKLPDAQFFGVGGAKMLEAGVEIVYAIGELSIIGVSGVLTQLAKIKDLFSLLATKLDELNPDLVILIDYPGFNLRFVKTVKAKNIPIVYYISPQVWAWGKSRIAKIKKYVKKMLVLFKFEEELYKKYGVDAEFVGHPLVDSVKPSASCENLKDEFGIKGRKIIALLPGSRVSEIQNLLPVMLNSFKGIQAKIKNALFLIAKHNELPQHLFEDILKKHAIPYKLVNGRTYDCIEASDLVIVASGSATLETAILGKPMIITYKVSPLTSIFFLLFVRITNIGLVNIVAGKRIVPELLQYAATPSRISREAIDILSNSTRYNQITQDLDNVRQTLGPPGASSLAASAITQLLNC